MNQAKIKEIKEMWAKTSEADRAKYEQFRREELKREAEHDAKIEGFRQVYFEHKRREKLEKNKKI